MMYIIYDNTFEGLLTAVFEIYEHKLQNAFIRKAGLVLPSLFEDRVHVSTDDAKVKRVSEKLKNLIGEEGTLKLWKVWLTEEENIEDCIFGTIRYAIEQKTNVLSDFGNLHVLQFNQRLKKIDREKHRMEAFVRFQLTKDELYFAVVEPDFNVLPLIIQHFQDRYVNQHWCIFDRCRHYGIYYDMNTTEFINFDLVTTNNLNPANKDILQENETLYQMLWKDYFDSTNIKSRKNMKLHLQHMPRRYWKYLTEKKPIIIGVIFEDYFL
jgi:probable DNA metabolism protein